MTNDEKQILAAELWKLSLPAQAVARELLAKCANEFAAETALSFLRGLPALPMCACEVSEELIAKLNAAVQVLRKNPVIWRDIKDYEGLYQVSNYGRVKSFQITRVFLPNPENKPMINHIDANKYNDCVWNLEWSTQSENMQHASKMGLLKGNHFCKVQRVQLQN